MIRDAKVQSGAEVVKLNRCGEGPVLAKSLSWMEREGLPCLVRRGAGRWMLEKHVCSGTDDTCDQMVRS